MKYIKCNTKNYASLVSRKRSNVTYIVIHYTAVRNDTAEAEARYFANNVTKTSTHFFIDRAGKIVKSVPMDHTAWSVGGNRYNDYRETGGARWYKACTNSNSVSIELCDIVDKDPSEAQIKALIKCVKYIRKYCTNIVSGAQIIRHFDVTGKYCPRTMCKPYGEDLKWNKLKARIMLGAFK